MSRKGVSDMSRKDLEGSRKGVSDMSRKDLEGSRKGVSGSSETKGFMLWGND
jgi:hypothetical protein